MILVFPIILGLAVGSFLTACIVRIPAGKSVVSLRSHCPHCQHRLNAWENIPVMSYLILRGRCSSCRSRISVRYPVVEILTALLFVALYSRFGLSLDLVVYALFLSLVVVITFIDMEHQIIPNGLLLLSVIPGVFPLIKDGFHEPQLYLFGAVGMGIGFFLVGYIGTLVFKKQSLGMGDVKYAALIGLVLGWQGAVVASALTFFSASMFFVILMIFRQVAFGQRVPLGPFLSLGTVVALFWGSDILNWYLAYFVSIR